MMAYEIQAKIKAGLIMTMVGNDLEWIGTDQQWRTSRGYEQLFEAGLIDRV